MEGIEMTMIGMDSTIINEIKSDLIQNEGAQKIWKNSFYVIAFLGITVLFPVLLSQSFVIVATDEYGIIYHPLLLNIDSEVKEQGRYYVPVGSKLITFKRTVQLLETEVNCLTQDGVEIDTEIKIQYQFIKNNIREILLTYGYEDDAENYLFSLARDSIRNTCSNFTISDVYYKRTIFQDKILKVLQNDFKDYESFTEISLVQLINVELPIMYVKVLDQIQSTFQEKSQAQNERVGQLIQQTTLYDLELRNYQIKLLQAQAIADSTVRQYAEKTNIAETIWKERAVSYRNIMLNLGFNGSHFVQNYLRSQVISLSNHTIINL